MVYRNTPYFYRPSGADQISVLIRRGPCIVKAVTKTWQIFAREKGDATASADDVIDYSVKIKGDTTLCRCLNQ